MRGMHVGNRSEFEGWGRGIPFHPVMLLVGIAAVVIIFTYAPWLPLLLIGFAFFRMMSKRHSWGHGGFGEQQGRERGQHFGARGFGSRGFGPRDFGHRGFGGFGPCPQPQNMDEQSPKRKNDSEYV